LLRSHLPKVIDIDAVVKELKHHLEGHWEYSFPGLLTYDLASPVFTVNGDLVLQLRPHDPHAKPPAQPAQQKKSRTAAAQGTKASVTTTKKEITVSTTVKTTTPKPVKKPSCAYSRRLELS
jgi:hypothetical protein